MKKYILLICLLILSVISYCDNDVIVVDLLPNGNKSTTPKVNNNTNKKQAVKVVPHKSSEKIKIGNYAVVIADIGYIYSKPKPNASILGIISYQDVVIVKQQSGDFYGILLENGSSIGWIYAGQLKKYDLEVWAKSKQKTNLPDKGISGYTPGKIPQSNIVIQSFAYKNTPYVYGGTSITSGMDCSAFVRDIFKKMYGISLPRTARQQATKGIDVPISQSVMKEGDRLYFRYKNSYIDHTGIYIGGGYYIHCNSAKHGVSIDYLWSKSASSKLVAVKRF